MLLCLFPSTKALAAVKYLFDFDGMTESFTIFFKKIAWSTEISSFFHNSNDTRMIHKYVPRGSKHVDSVTKDQAEAGHSSCIQCQQK